MTHSARTFRQRDVTRAVKALRAAGIDVQRVEISQEGKIILVPGKPETTEVPANELDRELAEWEERHAG